MSVLIPVVSPKPSEGSSMELTHSRCWRGRWKEESLREEGGEERKATCMLWRWDRWLKWV